jgi:Protein of unknown function (DUF3433)
VIASATITIPDTSLSLDEPARTADAAPQIPNEPLNGTLQSNLPLTLVDRPQHYFLGVYMPVLLAIILRLLVSYLYRCTKLVDPFNMLSQTNGVPLKRFFWSDHLGSESVLAPFKTLIRRRWTLFSTSILYAVTQLLTALASELTAIHPSSYVVNDVASNTIHIVRGRSLWVNSIIVRIIQGLLAFIFLQLLTILFLLRRSKPILRANPASIATIASLVAHPETSRDFSHIDQYAKPNAAIKTLSDRCYGLQNYIAPDGSECYGIVPMNTSQGSYPFRESYPSATSTTSNSSSIRYKDAIYLTLITSGSATLLGLVLVYALTSTSSSFERFMDSQSFGPRFMLSVLALLLKSPLLSLWSLTTCSLPFSRLVSRPRHAILDILCPVPVPQTPLGSIAYTVRRRALFATSLAIEAGLLVEIVLVLLPGVPFEKQQLYLAAQISWFGCSACLGLILMVAILGWIRLAVRRHIWPKAPNSLGAVAMYTAGTTLSRDCADGAVLPGGARFEFRQRGRSWKVEYEETRFQGEGYNERL